MTEEMEQRSYRGVKCLCCKQPIRISPLVLNIEAEVHTTPTGLRCHVFQLRCAACVKERQYKIAEILQFEAPPATLVTRVDPPSACRPGNNSRVTNA
jgi:hypothetical protein